MKFINTILAALLILVSSLISNSVIAKIIDIKIPSTKEGSELTIIGENLNSDSNPILVKVVDSSQQELNEVTIISSSSTKIIIQLPEVDKNKILILKVSGGDISQEQPYEIPVSILDSDNIIANNNETTETFLRPINVQNAFIDTEKKNELRVDFEWSRDNYRNTTTESTFNTYLLPRIAYRRAFDLKIPVRVGVSSALALTNHDFFSSGSSFATHKDAELGTTPICISLDASPVNNDKQALNIFFDQFLPTGSSSSNFINKDGFGDRYGFITGIRYQNQITKHISSYSNIGYAKFIYFDDNLKSGLDLLDYSTEFIVDTHKLMNLSLGLLGQSFLQEDIVNSLYVVPGLILPFRKTRDLQFRVGVPIGLTDNTGDIGVQASLFGLF